MKRTLTEIRTFNVRLYCECGGQYIFNGQSDSSYPPQYVHVCDVCSATMTLRDQYPGEETVEVGEQQEVPFE